MESFIKSSKNDSNQIPILEKVGFDSNHRVPNRDSDSALLFVQKCKNFKRGKRNFSLLAYEAEDRLWSTKCKEPNKASEWPSSFVWKRLPRN